MSHTFYSAVFYTNNLFSDFLCLPSGKKNLTNAISCCPNFYTLMQITRGGKLNRVFIYMLMYNSYLVT